MDNLNLGNDNLDGQIDFFGMDDKGGDSGKDNFLDNDYADM